jgi:uroporphyrinogen decarboxylase
MNKIERVTAVLEGRRPDRPPVSFWYHFPPECASGLRAVESHVRHAEEYNLDFLKIMDDNRYPRHELPGGVAVQASDLGRLSVLRGIEDAFSRQLDLIKALAQRFGGRMRMATTVFNAWTTLRNMTAPDAGLHGPPTLNGGPDPRDAAMSRFLREAPEIVERALAVVAESTANFARHCLGAGADGIYLSVRDDWVGTPENGPGTYDRLVRPGDLTILDAVRSAAFNILHVCGNALDFKRFAEYPVPIINWADRSAGPPIAEVANWLRPAICGGVDNLGVMVRGTADDCARQVLDALHAAGGHPMMISPGCTFDPHAVPAENLRAIVHAVDRGP